MVSQAVSLRSLTTGIWLLLALLLGSLLAAQVQADTFEASVDRASISEHETLTVTFSFSPQALMGTPDFSGLKQDFSVVQGPSRFNSFRSTNGQIDSRTEWSLVLTPLHSGRLTIPAITFKGQTSNPIEINVSQQSSQVQQQSSENAFFDIQVDQQPLYFVQSEILYTEKLYYRVNHQSPSLSDMAVEDARVVAIGEPRQYFSTINGERVGVYERRFAIYPEKTGTLVIPGQRFQAVATSRSNPYDAWQGRQTMITAASKPIELTISAIPANYPPLPWLPAKAVDVSDQFSLADDQWVVGEAVTRTIRINTEGLSASQIVLPEPVLPDGLKRYPDQPDIKDQLTDEGVTGVYQQAVALVPTQPGTLQLPEFRLAWWNTRTNQLEYASLPARTVTVKAAPNNAPTPAAPAVDSAVPAASDVAPMATNDGAPDQRWWLLTAVLVLTNLITLGLWLKNRTPSVGSPAVKEDISSAAGISRQQCWKLLKNACQQGDAAAVRNHLLAWAGTVCVQPPRSLRELQQQVSDPGLKAALAELDATLFSAQTNSAWNGTNLLVLLERWQKETASRPAAAKGLYPS
ncbi:BatD family protein [Parathalassolituus penaei]|uniref:BatD family protein n=1 Tax=Parathalassolituus penaei TaxID=2997323 RepID=A0A9X3EF93_9GAMM|nr:BatD family protein [Parathalassolituus penaei]MCY0966497.1 BatD family protein [Parathalassolituus penaei]